MEYLNLHAPLAGGRKYGHLQALSLSNPSFPCREIYVRDFIRAS
jgi:hypothetical protein